MARGPTAVTISDSDRLAAVFERVSSADLDHADDRVLAEVVAGAQQLRSWLDSIDLACVRRNRALHPEPSERGGRHRDRSLLTRDGRRSGREAAAATERADTCERVPQLGDALAGGEIGAGHLDAFGRAVAGLDATERARLAEHGDELADAARRESPEEFEQTCRERARGVSDDDGVAALERQRAQRRCSRTTDRDTGMSRTVLSLDPLTDGKVWTTIHAAIRSAQAQRQDDDPRTWDQFVADVVVDLLVGETTVASGVPEISVLVDLATLVDDAHADTVCETSEARNVPVPTLRRLCCDADLLPVVLGGAGIPLDVGREQRTATRAQRRALRAMYRCCGFPGCRVGFDRCRIHHVVHWTRGGRSDLGNLLPLCDTHHHLVHEGGWTLAMTPDRVVSIDTPDRTRHHRGDTRTMPASVPASAAELLDPLRDEQPDATEFAEPHSPPGRAGPAPPGERPAHVQSVLELAEHARQRAADRAGPRRSFADAG